MKENTDEIAWLLLFSLYQIIFTNVVQATVSSIFYNYLSNFLIIFSYKNHKIT